MTDTTEPGSLEAVKDTVRLILGHHGRMIAGSKSTYRKNFPKNLVLFNANVIVEGAGKVWHGDLDITRDEALLVRLAELTDREVYVLQEMDGRFDNEGSPKINKAIYKVSRVPLIYKVSRVPLFHWHIFLGESKSEYYVRHRRSGIIQERPSPRKKQTVSG